MSKHQEETQSKKTFFKEWIEPLLIAAIIALFIRQFGVQAFKIPSGSMIPTLTIGDHLLVNKFVYGSPVDIPFTDVTIFHMPGFRDPKRGEVIVFKYPKDESKDYIKRVVGLAGDKIEIRGGHLMINDQRVETTVLGAYEGADQKAEYSGYSKPLLLNEQLGMAKHQILYLHDHSRYNFEPVLVPQDSVFVMGDNRDNSLDGRAWGFVRKNKILGKAFIIYWSWDGVDRWVRWERIGTLIK